MFSVVLLQFVALCLLLLSAVLLLLSVSLLPFPGASCLLILVLLRLLIALSRIAAVAASDPLIAGPRPSVAVQRPRTGHEHNGNLGNEEPTKQGGSSVVGELFAVL